MMANKKISREESKRIMIRILNDVVRFCDERGITYFLAYGTLLGAVRHKGFIPWDDDIDIMMPRPDYERFIVKYNESGTYSICNPFDKDSVFVWSKVYDRNTLKIEATVDYSLVNPIGVDIDVFPLDGQPDDEHYEEFVKDTEYRLGIFNRLETCYHHLPKIYHVKSILRCLAHRIIGKKHYIKQYIQSAKKYGFDDSTRVGYMNPYFPYKDRYHKEIFEKKEKIEFEGNEYWAPAGYDEYLKCMYGDYMQLPPLEKRRTHHSNNIFWKN